MGCFDATCMVSNIGIGYNDPIVMLRIGRRVREKEKPSRRTWRDTPGVNMLYPGEEWSPIGLPFFGNYDDYGRIEDVKLTPGVDFTISLHNEDRGDEPFSLEDLCDREIDGETVNIDGRPYTIARTFMHRGIWEHLVNEIEYETYDRENERILTQCGIDPFRKSLAKVMKGRPGWLDALDKLEGEEADKIRKSMSETHAMMNEYEISRAIDGGEGEHCIGGLALYRKDPDLFLAEYPTMMALRTGMQLLRKSYLPLQTIGEQHSDDRRTKRFFETCTAIIDEKLKDYEDDE